MRVTEKLELALSASKAQPITFSFEFFVPKTSQGIQNLYDRMDKMYELNPLFIDITWNAGGRSSLLTNEIVYTAQSVLGLEACMHLTCTNMAIELIDEALERAYKAGCQNILALRGDPPLDGTESTGNFKFAKDLVSYIREKYGNYFDIGVAAYPDLHSNEESRKQALVYLKKKCDSGANFIVTQMFYDVDNFLSWYIEVRKIGIDLPIIPGIMPISTYSSFVRRAKWSDILIPQNFWDALEPIKDDDYLVREKGMKLVSNMCKILINSGQIRHLHFYTMNLERASVMILEELNLIESVKALDVIDDAILPWRKSLHPQRLKESIRPIFWRNRKYSYISRTSGWDEFPNGRWGDSRSPAFGDIDLDVIDLLRQTPSSALYLWGQPQTLKELSEIFVNYLKGDLKTLPWSDGPIGIDSTILIADLIKINQKGFFTTNSQPSLNAVRSNDKIYGWGPNNGFIYQKQYLEFFCNQNLILKLLDKIDSYNRSQGDMNCNIISYYAVNKVGKLLTNSTPNDVNAVTWGVFPGKEILQPTIVEEISFLAWKDEVYKLISEWIRIILSCDDSNIDRSKISGSVELLTKVKNEFFLCNLVNNNFLEGNKMLFNLIEGLNVPDLK